MLLYQNGRFYRDNISFAIPDGFYVEDDGDVTDEYGFCAWDPAREYLCCWRFYEDCLGTAEELGGWFLPECGMVPITEIAPIRRNGLSGHFVLYRDRRRQYYELRFDLGEGREFSLLAETRRKDIRRLVDAPAFQAVLEGIRAE